MVQSVYQFIYEFIRFFFFDLDSIFKQLSSCYYNSWLGGGGYVWFWIFFSLYSDIFEFSYQYFDIFEVSDILYFCTDSPIFYIPSPYSSRGCIGKRNIRTVVALSETLPY